MITKLKRYFRNTCNFMWNKPVGYVYMLHRVCELEQGKLIFNEQMKVTPEFLEQFILEKIGKYDFASLDQIVNLIKQNKKPAKPLIVFTLDDGYLDNYKYAYPIFKKYNIPFAIYVTSGFVDGTAIPWWFPLEDVIIKNDSIILTNGLFFNTRNIEEKESAFLQIRNIVLDLPSVNFEEEFIKLFSLYDLQLSSYNKDLFLNWEQIKELSKQQICTIASHTVNHRRLKILSKEEMINEIVFCKKEIEDKIGKEVKHFAYPFGSGNEVDAKVYEYIKEMGLNSAVNGATKSPIRKTDKNIYSINRLMLKVANE